MILDLNGFTIWGTSSCSETGALPNVITCARAGFLANGVAETSVSDVTVRNGLISGMQFGAITLSVTASVPGTEPLPPRLLT